MPEPKTVERLITMGKTMRTPEELLCSRKWRIAHSWWMLFGFFPFAVLAWIGYLIIGIRAHNWRWLLLAGLLLGWVIGWFAWAGSWPNVAKDAPHPDPVSNAWWGWLGLLIWFGNAFALQWFVNRRWLVWRAHHAKQVWYQDATASQSQKAPATPSAVVAGVIDGALAGSQQPRAQPGVLASAQPAQDAAMDAPGASQPATPTEGVHLPVQQDAGATTVFDLNTASREELTSLPGIDSAWADHIIATRERVGMFQDTAELVTVASMQPHIFAALRGRLRVAPSGPVASPRTQAPTSGRRLEF